MAKSPTPPLPEAFAILELILSSIPKFGALRERFEIALVQSGYAVSISTDERRIRAATVCECLYRFAKPPFTQSEAEGAIARHYYNIAFGNETTRRLAGNGGGRLRKIADEAKRRYKLLSDDDRRELIEMVSKRES